MKDIQYIIVSFLESVAIIGIPVIVYILTDSYTFLLLVGLSALWIVIGLIILTLFIPYEIKKQWKGINYAIIYGPIIWLVNIACFIKTSLNNLFRILEKK